ncbi:uncharacterized protein LOC114943493 [Nylanderia fulva]|uniref:uncharacterized protein LOC114943493 n=1 Tax=Nylanderia fulva TaxID=613905 RepID=UPI0010FBA622|nr:uncharacterized protein LOC114943493 [Nylanderia fulva]
MVSIVEKKVQTVTLVRRIDCDLTEIYINKELFLYMSLCFVREKLKKFRKKSRRKQLMEEVATITIQRMQPEKDICYEYVKSSLDSIAEAVLNCLREKHPNHSIFSTSAETFSYWRNNNIGDNYWDEAESTQIMDTLEEYIFGKLNFRLCQWTDRNVENLCIDNVLKNKCGQKTILLIIYESVARRLGLRCVLIKKEFAIDEYYIFCMPKYAMNRFENARCYDITFEEFPKCLYKQLSLFMMNRKNTLEDFILKPEEVDNYIHCI